jgi:phosphoribosylformylglycinamidine synthase
MRIKGTNRGLAMALAGNSRWCYLDPKLGAMHAVAEAARKVACTGATPVAATNCLNFGNPEKPEIMAQLSAAIDGIAEACTALGTPITGGNVSLYNETKGEGIYPTPVLGVVGILDDVTKAVPAGFQREGEAVIVIGAGLDADIAPVSVKDFGSSEFASVVLNRLWGQPPYYLDLKGEAQLQRCLTRLAQHGLISSASDIGDGGIAVTLAEASFRDGIGADVEVIPVADTPGVVAMFGESASRTVITCSNQVRSKVENIVNGYSELSAFVIGHTVRGRLIIRLSPGIAIDARSKTIDSSIDDLKEPWTTALESNLHDQVNAEVLA